MVEPEVNYEHPEYVRHKNQVATVQSVYDGIDTAKEKILRSPNEYEQDFTSRKEKATLDNYVERITTTITGNIFRKPIQYEGFSETSLKSFEHISGQDSLGQVAKTLTNDAVRDGSALILVDAPIDGGTPYLTVISRLDLINWSKDEEGLYTFAVIREEYEERIGRFGLEIRSQYRVIDEIGNVEIWRQSTDEKSATKWDLYQTIVTGYDFIPLYSLDIDAIPPLYDIAKININHLNAASKKDSYLETAGSPIPFGKGLGISGEDQVLGEGSIPEPALVLGVNSVVLTDNVEASFEWVEMTGGSIEALQADLIKKEDSMSARALTLQSESQKTATEVNRDSAESSSRLSDIAEDAEVTINNALDALSIISYGKPEVGVVTFNRDFTPQQMDGAMLATLSNMVMTGTLSKKTFLEALNEGEVIAIENIDDELAAIEDELLMVEDDNRTPTEPTE